MFLCGKKKTLISKTEIEINRGKIFVISFSEISSTLIYNYFPTDNLIEK